MEQKKELTGYPSIDKPWLKYYSDEAINAELPHMTLYQYAWENNKDDLEDTAFRYYGTKISYGEFFENVKMVAKSFKAMGIKKNDIVTVMSILTPETIYSFYALNYLGAVANMVYMTLSGKEIIDTLKLTDSKLLVVLDQAIDCVNNIQNDIHIPIVVLPIAKSMAFVGKTIFFMTKGVKKHNFLNYTDFIIKGKKIQLSTQAVDSESLAVIVYTSGSTGEPKGVMLSSDNVNAVVFQYKISGMHFARQETYLNMLPPFLAFGISIGLQMAICFGLNTKIILSLDSKKVAEQFNKEPPNHFVAGPAFIDGILKNIRGDLSNLINFAGGGGEIGIEKERELNAFLKAHDSKCKYLNGYGMTEMGSTVCTCMNHIWKEDSLGIPLPKSKVKIISIDDEKSELKYNEVGEILISAPNMMCGYLKNKSATAKIIEVDENGELWLHTGDLGLIDEDGFVYIKGRIKRIYLVKDKDGTIYKLFPQRIEELFELQPEIDKCGVIVIEDEIRLNVPIAYIKTKNKDKNNEIIIKKMLEVAERELPEHMRPWKIIILDDIPMTTSGKNDYRKLEEMFKG